MKEEDLDLVLRAQAGDERAFETLVEHYHIKVFHLLLGLVRDHGVAEELTQEALVRAWRYLKGFKFRSGFWTWLYRIAYRIALDYMRLKSLRPYFFDEWEPPADVTAEPVEYVLQKEREKKLLAALQELPLPQRAALILYFFEGLSYQEIAWITRRRIGTVRTDLHRGKKRLRQLLVEKWGFNNEGEQE
ncbi:MAG TPA: sigma-70 family RNA polymerase sigma factor [Bacillota bacterium]|jgi:RNA polymerase sigma-70 factor (ECF subfamily)|nr:sigma-70 family RNA polymerase sigma factor [Bacillota bacterium]HPT67606.1 sigma-70 family RNA polymerase sigma factor [Bacillota bacterium]